MKPIRPYALTACLLASLALPAFSQSSHGQPAPAAPAAPAATPTAAVPTAKPAAPATEAAPLPAPAPDATPAAKPKSAASLQPTLALPVTPVPDPFSTPALIPLQPLPDSFPMPPPPFAEPNLPELDIRQRASTALTPEGPNPTEEAARQLAARVRYHEVKVRALAVPEVRAALEASQTARSDRALREALRQHYTLLFRQIRALDSSLEPLIAEREKEAFLPLIEKLPRSVAARSR